MTPDIKKLRDVLSKSNNQETSFLRGCIADLIKDKADRNLLNICLNAGILQDFFIGATYDIFFVKLCKSKLVEDFSISEARAEKAIALCRFLTTLKTEIELIPYRKGNKWGFCNSKKEIIIDCIYNYAWQFIEGLSMVRLSNTYVYIDKTGLNVIPTTYGYICIDYDSWLATVEIHGKRCFMDYTGKILASNYDACSLFSEGLNAVFINERWGFIDITGKEIVPCIYDNASDFSEGLAAVSINEKWGFIDKSGKVVIQCKYNDVKYFSEGCAAVSFNEKWGFIDITGKEIVPCIYDNASDFSEGLAAVSSVFMWGFIDKNGHEVIQRKFYGVGYFSEGLVKVNINNKWGFSNKSGRKVIPCKYESAGEFHEGLACAQFNGSWGYIDKTGKVVISFKYKDADFFINGLAEVTLNSKKGYIDKFGTEYWED
jgi:hypothetical protein